MCARGTRVPVAVILDSLAEGASVIDVPRSYPTLKPLHVRAAVAYAAQLVRADDLRAHGHDVDTVAEEGLTGLSPSAACHSSRTSLVG